MADKNIRVKVTGETQGAKKQLADLKAELRDLLNSGKATDAELEALTAKIKRLGNESQTSSNKIKSSGGAAEDLSAGTGKAASSFGLLTGAIKGFIGVGLLKSFAELTAQTQNLQRMLAGLFGDSKAGAQQFEYTSQLAKRLGVEVYSLTDAYVKLAASTRGTSLEGEKTQKIFSSFATAMASMGAGTNDINAAMIQLSQGVSKGRFELEDVKAIMERIPGSANIFAESLGKTTKEFYDMISAGQLGRAEVEKMALGLEKVYGSDTKITGLSQSWNNFVTTLKSSVAGLSEATGAGGFLSGTVDALSKSVEAVGFVFSATAKTAGVFGKSLGALAAYADGGTWADLKSNIAEIGDEFSTSTGKMARKLFGLQTATDLYGDSQKKAVTVSKEFSSSVIDSAFAFTKAADSAEKIVDATKNQGDASVAAAQANLAQAQAVGQLTDVLSAKQAVENASAKAAQDNATATASLVDLSQKRAAAITAEIERLNALSVSNDSEAKAKSENIIKLQEELVQLNALIPKQQLQAQNAQTLSIVQAEQARAAQANADAMLRQTVNIDLLNQKHAQSIQWLNLLKSAKDNQAAADAEWIRLNDQLIALELNRAEAMQGTAQEVADYLAQVEETKSKLSDLSAVMAGGAEATVAIATATDVAKNSTQELTAAIQQRTQAQSEADELSRLQFDLESKNIDLKRIELQRRLDVAKARGDESQVQRLQNDLYKLEIEKIKAAANAKTAEIASLKEKLKLTQMQAELDGRITDNERRQIEISQQKIKIAESERQAFEATAKAKQDVMYATRDAVDAEKSHAAAANETTQAINNQATAKRTVAATSDGGSGGGGGGGGGNAGTFLKLARNDSIFKTQEGKEALNEYLDSSRKMSGLSVSNEFSGGSVSGLLAQAVSLGKSAEEDAVRKKENDARAQKAAARDSAIAALKEESKANDISAPSKIVRFELSSPSGQKFSVDAVGDSEHQLEAWLKSLAQGKMAAQ